MVKESTCNAGDSRDESLTGSGRSPGEGNGNLLQYSCLENPMDIAWWVTVHGGSKRVRHDWALMHAPLLIASLLKKGCMKHSSRYFPAQGPASQRSPSGKKLPSWAVNGGGEGPDFTPVTIRLPVLAWG